MDALLLLLLLLLPVIFFLVLRPSHKNLPPGPFAWPIMGNVNAKLNKAPHIALTELGRTHGPLMLVRFGLQPIVMANTHEAAMQVLKTHDRALSGRYIPHSLRMKNHIQHSLVWADCTENWKALRRVSRVELFSTKMLDAQMRSREEKVSELVNFLSRKEGEVVKLTDGVFGTLLNILGHVVFSKDVFNFNDKGDKVGMQRLIRELLVIGASPNLADFYPFLGGLDFQGLNRACVERVKQCNAMWESFVEERRGMKKEEAEKMHDFLQVLLNNGFNDAQINAMFLETFGPGSETSSTTIEWAMAELIKHPPIMAKVVEELNEQVGRGNSVKESHIPQLVYLQACIKETMRLHPAAPFLLPHRAVETCEVMGYTIPKDYEILVNAYAIGRDPRTWKDPLTFNPDRFLNSDMDYNGNQFQFIPFGAGRRICVGLPLASRTIPLILGSLIHCFEWNLPGGVPPEELLMNDKLSLTLGKDPPLFVCPKVKT
ncbi:Corytuberine synthase [Cinnamomum micranthum f. kanehirae]|uniref:Corytuberine synthase n=1 Tax=Cinnamomum micranthum f. kanehirae TaxID=337451 RepID=A0A3S3NBJ6_9MAGN|nr:Corytuberine synthase [Cinnamomum micranthum f. kanehirae]